MRDLRSSLVISIFLLPVVTIFFASPYMPIHSIHADSAALVSINPAVNSNRSQTAGRISVSVDLTTSATIDWFSVSFSYNQSILRGISINYNNTVLENIGPGGVGEECIDRVGTNCISPFDGPGVITMYLIGTPTVVPPVAELFQTFFNVTSIGLSQFHILQAIVHSPAVGTSLDLSTQDGYFTNMICGQVMCKPPVVIFTVNPTPPLSTGIPSTFNASSSQSSNSGTSTGLRFHWNWGDGTTNTITSSPISTHTYKNPRPNSSPFIVALTVTDTFGISWTYATPVQVVALVIDLALKSLTIDQTTALPGAQIHISALVLNNSTIAENATGTIVIGIQTLTTQQYTNLAPMVGSALLSATWNTTGLGVGRYSIQASVRPALGETNISNNSLNRTIELIPAADLQLSVAPSSISVDAGSQASVTLALSPFYGFIGTATFAVNTTTSLVGSFSANPVSLSTGSSALSVLYIRASDSLQPGSYILVVTANAGSISRSVSVTVRVEAPRILPSASLTILGLPPIEFWAIIAIIVAAAISGGTLAYRRRKRSFYF